MGNVAETNQPELHTLVTIRRGGRRMLRDSDFVGCSGRYRGVSTRRYLLNPRKL